MSRAQGTRAVQRQRLLTGAQEAPRSGEPRAARELRVVRGQLRRLAAAIESDEWHEVALLASVVADHLRDGGDVDGAESELEMVLGELAAFASEDIRAPEPEDESAAVVVVDDDGMDEPTDEGEAFEREPIEDDDDEMSPEQADGLACVFCGQHHGTEGMVPTGARGPSGAQLFAHARCLASPDPGDVDDRRQTFLRWSGR